MMDSCRLKSSGCLVGRVAALAPRALANHEQEFPPHQPCRRRAQFHKAQCSNIAEDHRSAIASSLVVRRSQEKRRNISPAVTLERHIWQQGQAPTAELSCHIGSILPTWLWPRSPCWHSWRRQAFPGSRLDQSRSQCCAAFSEAPRLTRLTAPIMSTYSLRESRLANRCSTLVRNSPNGTVPANLGLPILCCERQASSSQRSRLVHCAFSCMPASDAGRWNAARAVKPPRSIVPVCKLFCSASRQPARPPLPLTIHPHSVGLWLSQGPPLRIGRGIVGVTAFRCRVQATASDSIRPLMARAKTFADLIMQYA